MRSIRTILFPIFLFLFAISLGAFFQQNDAEVSVRFLWWQSDQSSISLFMFLAFCAGLLISGTYSIIENLRLRARLRKSRKMVEMLEREVDALRNQPLYDEPSARAKGEKSPAELTTENLGLGPTDTDLD